MHLPPALLAILFLHAFQQNVAAKPVPVNLNLLGTGDLVDRGACAGIACGSDSQFCCTGGAVCFTTYNNFGNPIAGCGNSPGGATAPGGWAYYTTTYVKTDLQTVVSTGSYPVAAPSSFLPQSTAVCGASQISCGAICCKSGAETCWTNGDCRPIQSGGATPTNVPALPTSTYSAPVKGTSVSVSTVEITTTQAFQTPVSTSGGAFGGIAQDNTSSGGLSGGAIAGIVIGVIAGVFILIGICFCCILKAGFDGILAIFGLGKKKDRRRTERTEIIESRYSRHGGSGAASRRETHGGWFGGGGRDNRSRVTEEKRASTLKKEGGTLLAIAAGLAGLAAILGLQRKKKKPARSNVSDVSYSYYTETLTSDSSLSSRSDDRRTRNSRHSRAPSRGPSRGPSRAPSRRP